MGKYIKKAKITGEVAVMEVAHHHQSSFGVRTRAKTKTLALERLQKPSPDSSSSSSSSCYLQLRSRRLEKPLLSKPRETPKPNPNLAGKNSRCSKKEAAVAEATPPPESDAGVEVSFGENVLEVEARSCRNARETTPCSPIRDSATIGTPGSTTRPTNTNATNRRTSTTRRNIPTSNEMEEFFAGAEQLQQKKFADKYNFDPVNECPLPGRYEWVKLDH